jgi:long-chain acyl-CoA synthetase
MRNASTPALVESPVSGNVTDHVEFNGHEFADAHVIAVEVNGEWQPMTAAEFQRQVRGVAKGLIADGIAPGDRVAIFSRTRSEWTIADYAIWYAGAITVPIYETSSAEQVQWMMQDSHVIATFFEATRTLYPFNEIASTVPQMTRQYIFAEGGLSDLIAKGAHISDDELDARRSVSTPNDTATIIYTSGTTGRPKGCVLTHGNLMSECDNLIAGIPDVFGRPDASTLLFCPWLTFLDASFKWR